MSNPMKLLSAARQRMSGAQPDAMAGEDDPEIMEDDTAADNDAPENGEPDGDEGPAAADGADDSDETAAMDDEEDPDMEDDETKPAARTAVLAERKRCAGILNCAEAKGRESSAQHLATNTDMTVKAAKALLATMVQASAAGGLAAKMAGAIDTTVGLDTASATAALSDPATNILANFQTATGRTVKTR